MRRRSPRTSPGIVWSKGTVWNTPNCSPHRRRSVLGELPTPGVQGVRVTRWREPRFVMIPMDPRRSRCCPELGSISTQHGPRPRLCNLFSPDNEARGAPQGSADVRPCGGGLPAANGSRRNIANARRRRRENRIRIRLPRLVRRRGSSSTSRGGARPPRVV